MSRPQLGFRLPLIFCPSPCLILTCFSLPAETKLSELYPSPVEGGVGEACLEMKAKFKD